MDSLIDMVTWRDILAGLMKSVGFGFIVAIIGCYKGLTTTGGAQGVGQSTTKTVVLIITSILVTNYFFSLAFFAWLKYEGAL
jgi:phospholipid/cholesterol/gamma-HCH transport system permease protein